MDIVLLHIRIQGCDLVDGSKLVWLVDLVWIVGCIFLQLCLLSWLVCCFVYL
jgi:hypothetical protein